MSNRPRILLFTGDGKGKTTAAFGMVLRAVGGGLRCVVLHFLKEDDSVGEFTALQRLGVPVRMAGLGFVPSPNSPQFQEHAAAASAAISAAAVCCDDPAIDMVVLDEICGAVALGLVAESAVVSLCENARLDKILVLTGRGATPALMTLADTVTEMRLVKHAYDQNIPASRGIEF